MLKKLSLLVALAVTMLFSACGDGVFTDNVTLEIDNALDTTVVVQIDSATYTLEADSAIAVTFPVGEYKLNVKTVTDSLVQDTKFTLEDKGDAILNISNIEYVVEYVYYSTSGSYAALDAYTFKYDTLEFPSVRAEAVGTANDLVVYGDWTYGLTEEVPETISTYADGGTWREKVQRMDDFVLILQISQILENMDLEGMDFDEMLDDIGEEEGEEEDHGHDH